ncbi:unnamed protein product, partial [marine sediment metagenome]
GISSEIVSLVFEPFFTTKKKGTGLGLSIVRSILEKYGSSIEYLSDSKGAHFRIIINNLQDKYRINLTNNKRIL